MARACEVHLRQKVDHRFYQLCIGWLLGLYIVSVYGWCRVYYWSCGISFSIYSLVKGMEYWSPVFVL